MAKRNNHPRTLQVLLPSMLSLFCMNSSFAKETELETINFELMIKEQNPYGFALPLPLINDKVSQNLANARYPVKSGQTLAPLHLEAQLEKISHQQTPPGFSFSSGNSDPRAMDFQKADVLPINCRLTNNTGKLIAEEQTAFSYTAATDGKSEQKQIEQLIEHISSACFSLLESAKTPLIPNSPDNQPQLSSWHPNVRIQTIETEVVNNNVQAKTLNGKVVEEPKKQLIIENQGTPVIFKFGNDRQ